jgi:hypothetical protein
MTDLAQQLKAVLEKVGVNVISVTVLGRFAHVDTFQKYESKVFEVFNAMKASKISVMQAGADGLHLDGTRSHRIVAFI